MAYKGLPIWQGFPHSTSVLNCDASVFGITRVLDYDGTTEQPVTMDYSDEFITDNCDGVYIKFLNSKGGYSYWLFSHVFIEETKVKSLGQITNHWDVRALATTDSHSLGYKSKDTLSLFSRVKNKYVPEMRDILDSTEIYLYTGNLKGILTTNYCDWIKVKSEKKSLDLRNSKHNNAVFDIDIALPKRYRQTLV